MCLPVSILHLTAFSVFTRTSTIIIPFTHPSFFEPSSHNIDIPLFRKASATFRDANDSGVGGVEEMTTPCIDSIPPSLQMAISPKGCVETYPEPYHQFDRLGYYLMDASSILPVLAMDVQEGTAHHQLCCVTVNRKFKRGIANLDPR